MVKQSLREDGQDATELACIMAAVMRYEFHDRMRAIGVHRAHLPAVIGLMAPAAIERDVACALVFEGLRVGRAQVSLSPVMLDATHVDPYRVSAWVVPPRWQGASVVSSDYLDLVATLVGRFFVMDDTVRDELVAIAIGVALASFMEELYDRTSISARDIDTYITQTLVASVYARSLELDSFTFRHPPIEEMNL